MSTLTSSIQNTRASRAIPFAKAEYDNRIAAFSAELSRRGLIAAVISDPANMNYLTGFDATSFYVPQVVIVPADGSGPAWIGRRMDVGSAEKTTYLSEQAIIGYDDGLVESAAVHPMQVVGRTLEERGWAAGRIGVELEADYFSVRAYHVLAGACTRGELTDISGVVNWLRAVKSDAEIEYMRQAAKIADAAMAAGVEAIRPGVRESDAMGEIMRVQTAGTDELAGDYVAIAPWALTGKKVHAPHASWNADPFERGDSVMIGVGGVRARYHAALCRAIYLGTPDAEFYRLVDAVQAGFAAALEAIKPGNTCGDVDGAWRREIGRRGYAKEARIGYAIGIAYPPTWGERTMSFRPGDQTVLAPNMTFHLLTGMLPELPYDLSETVRVTATGAESLTSYPREFLVKS